MLRIVWLLDSNGHTRKDTGIGPRPDAECMIASAAPSGDEAAVSAAREQLAAKARGIRSGEILVRVRAAELSAENGAAFGLAPTLHKLVFEPPTLQEMMAPWETELESIQRRKAAIKERKRLLQQRCEAACDAINTTGLEEILTGTPLVGQYGATLEALESLYKQQAMRLGMQYYRRLESERAWISSWQKKEGEACQELLRAAKRRQHFDLFGVHLQSETLGCVNLWRLVDDDAQRARCIKAATENLKKGFVESSRVRVQVSDVYKIENKPALQAFEHWISQLDESEWKVKGLFCSVPSESLERCVVWGMFPDESALASAVGGRELPVFNRPRQRQCDVNEQAPGTRRRPIAEKRVQDADAMEFPRRFSRYSTLNELLNDCLRDVELSDPPVRYLALCRVAMGKILRVTAAQDDPSASFPANSAFGSIYLASEEEYVVRYPQAVVPEFFIEYRFIPENREDASIPTSLCSAPSLSHDDLPSVRFDNSARHLIDNLRRRPRPVLSIPPPISLFEPEHSRPSVFGADKNDHRKYSAKPAMMTTDQALETSARQRTLLLDDVHRMRRVLWIHAKSAWEELQPLSSINGWRENDEEEKGPTLKAVNNQPKQSLKARKLYGELALERQLQARDMVLNNGVKAKPQIHARRLKPRPFR